MTARLAARGHFVSMDFEPRVAAASSDSTNRDTMAAIISAHSGSFRGAVSTTLWSGELAHLQALLVDLDRLVGQAGRVDFLTTEGALALTFTLTSLGQLRVGVKLRGPLPSPYDARLTFSIDASQSFLPTWIDEIARVRDAVSLIPEPDAEA